MPAGLASRLLSSGAMSPAHAAPDAIESLRLELLEVEWLPQASVALAPPPARSARSLRQRRPQPQWQPPLARPSVRPLTRASARAK